MPTQREALRRGEVLQRFGLDGTVNDLTFDASGEVPVNDLQGVGADVLDAQGRRQRSDHLDESAADQADRETQVAQRCHQGAGTGGEPDVVADLVEHRHGQPGQRCDALVQEGGEVEFDRASRRR